jgi:hypothetical protein
MKIFFTLPVFALSLVFLSGCTTSPSSQEDTPKEETPSQQVSSEGEEDMVSGEKDDKTKMQWIKQLQQGEKLSCVYQDEQGGQAEVFMDGEDYRMEYTSELGNVTSVSREGVLYVWGDQMPSGMKIAQDCFEDFDTTGPSTQEYYSSSEEVVEKIPDISCTSIDSVDTSISEDISFVDQCDILGQLQQMEIQIPEGVEMIP